MSRYEFRLPDIGEGVTEGEIVGWLVKAGDRVTENQDMVEVMTDKATVTIGAPKDGRVVELRGNVGDTIPVGEVVVVLALGDGEVEAPVPRAAASEGAVVGAGEAAASVQDDDGSVLAHVVLRLLVHEGRRDPGTVWNQTSMQSPRPG